MDFTFTRTQNMLKRAAASFLKAEAPPHAIARWLHDKTTYLPDLYRKTAELGWLGMLIPREYGGSGAPLMDCAVLFEELGRGPLPGPLFSSGVLSALVILEAGSEQQRQALLPAIRSAEAIVVPAIADKGPYWGPEAVETRLSESREGLVLEGTKQFVLDAEGATHFICAARASGGEIALVLVDRASPGIAVARREGFLVGLSEVRFEGVRVPAANLLGEVGGGWQALERALLRALPILCAYKVGACQEIFDFTTEYTRIRVVFGQPIGRFQRVQDHCVDLSIHMDAARWVTYETLWKLESGLEATASVHEAKAVASEAYYKVCDYAHMVFAGVGTDYTHPLMAHSVMAHTLYQYLGSPLYHKRKMMDALYPRREAASPL